MTNQIETTKTEAAQECGGPVDPLVMCAYCKHWDRQYSVNKKNEILKGFISKCTYLVNLPDAMPKSLQIIAMNWDDGTECKCFEKYSGEVIFST